MISKKLFQGYPPVAPVDNRYGGAPAVPAGGAFNTQDPYGYGKAPGIV